MAEDRAKELQALGRVIETCRDRAVDLDLPGLAQLLDRAEAILSGHAARDAPSSIPRARALSVPRGRPVRH